MDITQLDHAVRNGIIKNEDRIWLYGASFRADIPVPQLCIPFTEAEVHVFNTARNYWGGRRENYGVFKVSEKTGRVLSKAIAVHFSTADRGGNFDRSQHIFAFTHKEDALRAYEEFIQRQTEVINEIIAQETEKYNGWLAKLQEPLAREVAQ